MRTAKRTCVALTTPYCMTHAHMINIVTDSTSDIPPDIARELNITVIPVHVIFGEESFDDGVTITREEFYRRLKTSSKSCPPPPPPAPASLPKCINASAARSSPSMSRPNGAACSTWRSSARQLAPEAQVTFFDSGKLAMGLGWQVILAARAAQQGQSVAEIMQVLARRQTSRALVCRAGHAGVSAPQRASECAHGALRPIAAASNPSSMSATAKSTMIDRVRTRHAAIDRAQRDDVRARPAAITGRAAYRQLRNRARPGRRIRA